MKGFLDIFMLTAFVLFITFMMRGFFLQIQENKKTNKKDKK